jgi:hypothetical protein
MNMFFFISSHFYYAILCYAMLCYCVMLLLYRAIPIPVAMLMQYKHKCHTLINITPQALQTCNILYANIILPPPPAFSFTMYSLSTCLPAFFPFIHSFIYSFLVSSFVIVVVSFKLSLFSGRKNRKKEKKEIGKWDSRSLLMYCDCDCNCNCNCILSCLVSCRICRSWN